MHACHPFNFFKYIFKILKFLKIQIMRSIIMRSTITISKTRSLVINKNGHNKIKAKTNWKKVKKSKKKRKQRYPLYNEVAKDCRETNQIDECKSFLIRWAISNDLEPSTEPHWLVTFTAFPIQKWPPTVLCLDYRIWPIFFVVHTLFKLMPICFFYW